MTRRKLAVLLAGPILPIAAAPPQRFEINGHVAGHQPGHVVVIRTTGKGQHSASTHADGTFVLRGLLPGSYTLRPQSQHYHFAPVFRTVVLTTHDLHEVNFTAHPAQPTKKR
jgi:hypothetical protein